MVFASVSLGTYIGGVILEIETQMEQKIVDEKDWEHKG